jgi:hypothetical protein
MAKSGNENSSETRLALAERAIAEMASRLDELTAALAEAAQLKNSVEGTDETEILISADDISPFAAGFYQREHDRADRAYRWTGRGDFFEIRFNLNRNIEWSFAVEISPNSYVNMFALRAFADYIEIPIELQDGGRFIQGTIPRKFFCSAVTLTFHLPGSFVPNLVDPMSSDSRSLGVVFYEMRVTPQKLSVDAAIAPETLHGLEPIASNDEVLELVTEIDVALSGTNARRKAAL